MEDASWKYLRRLTQAVHMALSFVCFSVFLTNRLNSESASWKYLRSSVLALLGRMELHVVDGLLELPDELTQIFRIDYDALSDVSALIFGAFALNDVEVHVALVVLLDVEEIRSVVCHEPS